ncbi:MAG: hypothetical protein CME64_01660 [Halobacteriovoraceae bacterium]|nr:hypothetical protein [Halobacteriovoraceae bacterium]|tara:strand:- start:90970 stop:91776 length:807 start_codon:yes stop_codon:yes gene_type:complete
MGKTKAKNRNKRKKRVKKPEKSFNKLKTSLKWLSTLVVSLTFGFFYNNILDLLYNRNKTCNAFRDEVSRLSSLVAKLNESTEYKYSNILPLSKSIETLFYDGRISESLFSGCRKAKDMLFLKSGGSPIATNLFPFDGMVYTEINLRNPRAEVNYNPILKDGNYSRNHKNKSEWVLFEPWWESYIYYSPKSQKGISRKQLVVLISSYSDKNDVNNYTQTDLADVKDFMRGELTVRGVKQKDFVNRKSHYASLHNIGLEIIKSYGEFNKK